MKNNILAIIVNIFFSYFTIVSMNTEITTDKICYIKLLPVELQEYILEYVTEPEKQAFIQRTKVIKQGNHHVNLRQGNIEINISKESQEYYKCINNKYSLNVKNTDQQNCKTLLNWILTAFQIPFCLFSLPQIILK